VKTKGLTPKCYFDDLKLIVKTSYTEEISEIEDTISEIFKFKNITFKKLIKIRLKFLMTT